MLSIEGNVLKDRKGKVIVAISQELGWQSVCAYTHAFAASSDLLAFMKHKMTTVVGGYDAFKQERTLLGHRPYTDISVNSGFPDWVKRGTRAIALAEGEAVPRNHYPMLAETNLRPLTIEGNTLKDDVDQVVAVLSKELNGDEVNAYARTFAASVELLDIINFKSGNELADMKKEYGAAQEFNKHKGVPSNIAVLGASKPYIPDELERLADSLLGLKARNTGIGTRALRLGAGSTAANYLRIPTQSQWARNHIPALGRCSFPPVQYPPKNFASTSVARGISEF